MDAAFSSHTRTGPVVAARPGLLVGALLWVQGLYFLATGIWPLISVESFQAVTGPKSDHLYAPRPTEADHWLVMTVAVLVTAIGIGLVLAAARRRHTAEIAVIAVAAAVGLTAIDVIYVMRGVLRPIYLADAALEVVFIIGWLAALVGRSFQR